VARSDLLLNLVRAGVMGESEAFRRTVEAIAAEERDKNHRVLAERLEEELADERARTPQLTRAGRRPGPFLAEKDPRRGLDELVLEPRVAATCREIVEEQNRAELLRAHNLEPRHRLLLIGPPGVGKTSLAEALAHELMVPLLVVRYERLVGSYLGETAERLAEIFDYARTRRCVLFFDEFDTVGKERGDAHETGEVKRLVASLLMQVDELPSYVVAVGASNHPELLDRAVWRRFEATLELPMPTPAALTSFFERFETRARISLGLSPRALANRTRGCSFSDAERLAIDVLRRFVLAGPSADMRRIAKERLDAFRPTHVAAIRTPARPRKR
jgi:AAA+ superfamily predicted ATPase